MISRRRAAVLALTAGCVAAVAASVAACGNGSSGTASPAASASGTQAQLTAYVDCLKQNGVTVVVPSGRAGGGGFGGSGRPTAPPNGDRTVFPTDRPTARPSGSFGPGGFGGGGFGGGSFLQKPADVDQATWDKAQTACSSLRPSFGAGNGRSGGADNGAMAAYRNCLREHGSTDAASPSAEAAAACAVLKPTAAASASS